MLYYRWYDVDECLRGGDPQDALKLGPVGQLMAGASVLHLLAHRGGRHTKEGWFRQMAGRLIDQARMLWDGACCEV